MQYNSAKNGKNGVSRRKKGNPHPNHILSYSETSPKERENVATVKGECGDGKRRN